MHLEVVPSQPEGASAPSPTGRCNKCVQLARAFENVSLERAHWRKQAERLRQLIAQMAEHMKPYEGE